MEEAFQSQEDDQRDLVGLTADIVSAYVSNNRVPPSEMPALLASVHAAVAGLGETGAAAEAPVEKLSPAQIRKSIRPDALISFIDGKPYKTLKRHLTKNGMTMDDYRSRFGLPSDYPATAASYSAQRSELARSLGLGRRPNPKAAPKAAQVTETVAEPVVETKARARKGEAAAPANPARGRKAKTPAGPAATE